MRILLYNWIPFNNGTRGGGVTVYLKNLVDKLLSDISDIEIVFLCSGVYYDEIDNSFRYELVDCEYDSRCKIYTFVNSPIFSPAFVSFFYIDKVISNSQIENMFIDFCDEVGPFDVIHFHNLEGLPINIMKTRRNYPHTKYIYSMHNYYAFCPQVNMWKCEREQCFEGDTGEECIACMTDHVPAEKLVKKMAMTYNLVKNYSPELENKYKEIGKKLDEKYAEDERRALTQDELLRMQNALKQYRKRFVEAINSYVDVVLAVSDRVRQIAIGMGVKDNIIKVNYIGTKAAEEYVEVNRFDKKDNILSLIYMGYQRRDKGFYFLIDVLNQLDDDVAIRIDLTIAAKQIVAPPIEWSLDSSRFHSYTFQNGYAREEIKQLLNDKDLGIIPVLWEDNLPQVAIEMTANGVPVLCSDRGGTKELCDDPKFCFKAGDDKMCAEKISYFVNNPNELSSYYDSFKGLTTMDDHIKELMKIYEE